MKRQKSVLILAYYSYLDPVFQSAVLPYFLNLAKDYPLRFVLMTFEQSRFEMSSEQLAAARELLLQNRIVWYRFTWHSGRFKLVKKAFDLLYGASAACCLALYHKVSVVYSEGFPGAIIGHCAALLTRRKHVVHSFEPHADSSIESGEWNENAWEARLLKHFESKIAFRCSDVLTATEAYARIWKQRGCSANFHRVPSCVDVDHFRFDNSARIRIRQKFGLKPQDKVLVYLGKFEGMYWGRELGTLFEAFYKLLGERAHFLIITIESLEQVWSSLGRLELPQERVRILSATRAQVPQLLSAADVGVCAVRQRPSKRYCSPIKNGEYWACGLPILIPRGISDDYLYATEFDIGVEIEDETSLAMEKSVRQLVELWNRYEDNELRERTRSFAVLDRSVESYRSLLAEILLG